MNDLRQAAQQALEALEHDNEQEVVAWQWLDTANYRKKLPADAVPEHWTPLYTAPTPRKPLTDEEIINIGKEACAVEGPHILPVSFARAIERAHGIGGGE